MKQRLAELGGEMRDSQAQFCVPRQPMLKHSVANRMLGTFAIIFSSKTLGFRKILIVVPLEIRREL
jgi:hypothetical protein